MNFLEKDRAHIWHPYTQYATATDPIFVDAAKDALLIDEEGNEIIDAVSSWWVNIHGHSNERLAAAIHRQFLRCEHVIFAGFTHQAAIDLASALKPHLPGQADKLFFSDNGSTAVEVGVKMAIQYFYNKGESHRRQVICFDEGFHGETFGAMSLSGDHDFNNAFKANLFDVKRIPAPIPGQEELAYQALEQHLVKGDCAAFLFEPLVLGAGGMLMYSPEQLSKLIALAKSYGCLTIADEVMTGFGRTGTLFACDQSEEKPDIIAMSKGLTGGSMPLGLTSCSEEIFEAFVSKDKLKTFFHGHSYTGNPLACAVGLESLAMLLEDERQSDIKRIVEKHAVFAEKLSKSPAFKSVRQCGTILAFEYATEEETGYFNSRRDALYEYFLAKGVLLRPLGNVIYILPPYCMTSEELDKVYSVIEESVNESW